MSKVSKNDLFSDFSPLTKEEWRKITEEGLKGKPFEKLIWNPAPSISIEPYYTQEDISDFSINSQPSLFPFRRGNQFNGEKNNWQIVQEILATEDERVFANIKEGQDNEITAFSINFDEFTQDEIRAIFFKNIHLSQSAIHVKTSQSPSLALVELYLSTANKKIRPDKLTGTLSHDPISRAAAKGKKVSDISMVECEGGMINSHKSPHFRTLGIDVSFVHQKGGNTIQEIAFGLATLVDYLDYYQRLGTTLSLKEMMANVAFTFATGPSFFLELAKLRAFRILYSKVVEAWGIKHPDLQSPFIISRTSDWHISKYDRHNNLLRGTTEAISAIAGGTNALIVSPYDPDEDDFSESTRLGRNIQHLLKYESYLNQVVDPGGGAYYVEQITEQLCEAAWKLFQRIEGYGGMIDAVDSGMIEALLNESLAKTKLDLNRRKKIMVGVNHFPGVEKSIPSTDHRYTTLGEEFEAIRRKTDYYAEENNRPIAFLFSFGNAKMRNARLQFSRNLLACAGISIQTNAFPNDQEKSLSELTESKADFIVLCAADTDYGEKGSELIDKMKDQLPNSKIILAGNSDKIDDSKLEGKIFSGMNSFEFLGQLISNFIKQ